MQSPQWKGLDSELPGPLSPQPRVHHSDQVGENRVVTEASMSWELTAVPEETSRLPTVDSEEDCDRAPPSKGTDGRTDGQKGLRKQQGPRYHPACRLVTRAPPFLWLVSGSHLEVFEAHPSSKLESLLMMLGRPHGICQGLNPGWPRARQINAFPAIPTAVVTKHPNTLSPE